MAVAGATVPAKPIDIESWFSRADVIRYGPTPVSNQLIEGPGATGARSVNALKGGGKDMGFHYHLHQYNWSRPWLWFKSTPIIK